MIKKFLCLGLVLGWAACLYGADLFSWDFESCEIKDILFVISGDTGISIVSDDTVNGKGSLKFFGKDFSVAFDSFLEENRLFVVKTNDKWIVSRFRLQSNNDLYSLDVCDLMPVQILEKLSLNLDEVINYDQLPSVKLSIHLRNVTKQELMESVAARFGAYQVKTSDRQITFFKQAEVKKLSSNDGYIKINILENNSWELDIKNSLFFSVLEKLFEENQSHKSYCLMTDKNTNIIRSKFNSRSFEAAFEMLCNQNNYSFIEIENVFYIVRPEVIKNEFLFGSLNWRKFTLNTIPFEKVSVLINRRFGKTEVLEIPGTKEILCCGTEKLLEEISVFISEIDVMTDSYLIVPKYLSNEEFIEKLPPEFDKAKFKCNKANGPVYFYGTEYEYKKLCKQSELFDLPPTCIQYDLLILQYDESVQNNWATSFSANRLSLGDRNNLGVQLGSVMSLNLNVISAFGLTLAANIQSSIEENNTKVFADTVLYGISGKTINFQNTSTYRYRDNNLDPETGKPIYSGVTREISSGIKLEVCGWVSGEGIITSSVTASVSRQGIDTSSSTGNPPPTTEKVVTTEVCGKNGEPIILSGLIQKSTSEEKNRKPVLSSIPILRKLFENKHSTKEKSQMVIFLVPHINFLDQQKSDFLTEEWAVQRIEKLHKEVM